jgi:hypothetical protein
VETLLAGTDGLPLAAINDRHPGGQGVALASAKQVLTNLGKNRERIAAADAADTAKIFPRIRSTATGSSRPRPRRTALQAVIKDIIACTGGCGPHRFRGCHRGKGGPPSSPTSRPILAWVGQSDRARPPPCSAPRTDAALAALKAVRAKVEDYFARCRLAAFDGRALAALNRSGKRVPRHRGQGHENHRRGGRRLSRWPASRRAGAAAARGRQSRVGPALATLHADAVTPCFGGAKTDLTEAEWTTLNAKLTAYEGWLGGKAGRRREARPARVKAILAARAGPCWKCSSHRTRPSSRSSRPSPTSIA